MDYSKRTAQECMEDYENRGITVTINDGKVSGDSVGDSDGCKDGGM